jgi:hypothetical protein
MFDMGTEEENGKETIAAILPGTWQDILYIDL